MANLLHSKGTRNKVLSSFPTNNFGNDGDIVVVSAKSRGVYLCIKSGNRWHAANKLQDLQRLEKTSLKNLKLEKLKVGNTTITNGEYDVFSGDFTLDVAGNIILEATTSINSNTPLKIKEAADAVADTIAYGQLWVKTATPNELYFTTDAGNDIQLTSGTTTATTGTVTSVAGTGTVNGLTVTGTVTSSGNLTLGGTLAINNADWSGTDLAIANGGTGASNSDAWLNSRITTNADGSLNYDATGATAVNHDNLTGFVPEEHVDWAGVSAGTIHASNYVDNNTTYTGGTNLTLAGTTFNVDDAFLKNNADDSTSGTITADGFNSGGTWTFADASGGDAAIQEVHSGTSFADDDTSLMTSGAIKEKIENYGYGTSNLALGTSGSTALAGNTALLQIGTSGSTAMAGNTAVGENNVSGDSGNSAIYDNSGTPTLKSGITQAEMQTAIGGVYTDTDVSVANLDARLNELSADTVTVGVDDDTDMLFQGQVKFGRAVGFTNLPPITTLGALQAWNWDKGNKQHITLISGNNNLTFVAFHPIHKGNYVVKLTQPASGSAGTVTWSAESSYGIKWAGGSAPTLSTANGAIDIISFYYDQTCYYGVASLNFS